MPDYTGNSKKTREEEAAKAEKKIERITSAEVIVQKRGPWRTFKGLIIEADMGSLGRFLWLDMIVPMMKNAIVDITDAGIKRAVYGDRRAGYRPPPSSALLPGRESRITYGGIVSRNYIPEPRAGSTALPAARSTSVDARSYLIADRTEAEEVLHMMSDVIDRYNVVAVSELHEMLGLDHTHIDTVWGWTDLRSAQIRQVREGWVLELPQPQQLQY